MSNKSTIRIFEDIVNDVLVEKGILEDGKLVGGKKKERTSDEKIQDVQHMFLNGGCTPSGEKLSWQDAFSSNEIKSLIPQVVNNIITMPRDPIAKLKNLYKPLTIPKGQAVSFPQIGGLPEAQDMGEAEQYPTTNKLEMQGSVTAMTGKVGLKVSFTDEVWELSKSSATFDIVALILQSVGRGLDITKERKAAHHLLRQGQVSFDNISAGGRRTSGRDSSGSLNATLLSTDLVQVWSEMMADGFTPDIIIFHPLAFPMFIRDEELRTWAFQNGAPAMNQIWQRPQGVSGARQFTQNVSPLQKRNDPFTELSSLSTVPAKESTPFTLNPIVTPWAFYSPAIGNYPAHVDIIVADSSKLGFFIEEEGKITGEWIDPETDIRNFKVAEKYTYATEENGAAIRIIKGIAVDNVAFDFINNFSYSPTFNSALDLSGFNTGTDAGFGGT